MFARLSNSWELVKASFAVLKADKELVVFPIVSMIGSIIVMITFAIPLALAGFFDSMTNKFGIAHYIVLFFFYLVMYFVVIFSNSALVGAAMIRLRGGDPTLKDGFTIAMDHLQPILGYALISATVGVILRAIAERNKIIGQIVSSILGAVWGIVTYLVVPVLVTEDVGPVDAIKRSGSLLKKTWGEQIIGNFSIGAVFGLLILGAIIGLGIPLGLLIAATGSVIVAILGVVLIVLVVVGLSLLSSALGGIYTAALYRYAVEGQVSAQFSPELIQGAFKAKRG
jgi:hypothetical protein